MWFFLDERVMGFYLNQNMEVTARIFVFKGGFMRVMKSPAVGKKSYSGGLFVIFCLGRMIERYFAIFGVHKSDYKYFGITCHPVPTPVFNPI